MNSLTPRQLQLVEFIGAYAAAHGVGPSYGDIVKGMGLKTRSAVTGLLERAIEKGAIVRLGPRRYRIPSKVDADHHLRAVLSAIDDGLAGANHPAVAAAVKYARAA